MDLSSLAVSESSKLTIVHPVTKQPLDIVIGLCGKDSDTYRAKYSEMVKAIAESQQGGGEPDFAKLDIDTYVACTLSWENVEMDGSPLDCTPDNVRTVYSDSRFKWLHEQVIEFVGNRENFM